MSNSSLIKMLKRVTCILGLLICFILLVVEILSIWNVGANHTEDITNIADSTEVANEQITDSAVYNDSRDVVSDVSSESSTEVTTEETTERVLDVWDMGYEWYGISYEDTTRTLKLITYEGYGYSPLSYYVACCCWVRATEGYWGHGNLFSAFGGADTSYDLWMDELGIADYAYQYLEECYKNPTYVRYCNGVSVPLDYIYYEGGIYVWN